MTTSEHPGWQPENGVGRWSWAEPDNTRHLLLKVGDDGTGDRVQHFVELHSSTLHRYVQVGETPLGSVTGALYMTTDLRHRDSVVDETLPGMVDDTVWQRMLEHGQAAQ